MYPGKSFISQPVSHGQSCRKSQRLQRSCTLCWECFWGELCRHTLTHARTHTNPLCFPCNAISHVVLMTAVSPVELRRLNCCEPSGAQEVGGRRSGGHVIIWEGNKHRDTLDAFYFSFILSQRSPSSCTSLFLSPDLSSFLSPPHSCLTVGLLLALSVQKTKPRMSESGCLSGDVWGDVMFWLF